MGKVESTRPPGPRGRWMIGNSHDYDQDRIGFLRRCNARYGDVFSFSPSTIVVCDPDLVHEIFDRSNGDFIAESPLLGRAANDGLAERSFDGWMRARQLGVRAMTRSVTKAHGNRILAAFDTVLRATAGRDFDVVTVMHRYTSRIVADFLFGPGADDVVVATELRSRYAARFLNSTLTVPRWLPLPSVRRTVRADERILAVIAGHVADRRSHRRERPQDMLDLLLADAGSLATDDIIALLKASMLASAGSPAVALSWALCELARNQLAYERLRDEARHAIAETGSLADDAHLTYSKAFAREVLRLYPPTWLMGRTVRNTCTLGGWTLSAGQQVVFSPYLLQRDPRWWPEPERFWPERWLTKGTAVSRRAYIPFGSGPRICLGLHLSQYQLVTAISQLAAHYRVELSTAIEPVPNEMLLPLGLRARIVDAADSAAAAQAGRAVQVSQ